ncbi:hypothetical protein [Streptomyces sp. RKAG337]|uniref:hypothetical protein n=1 Tax=Streptomyces sp. RKAG337 TaxID=2893404 RepID=UPI00203384DF|nr:hypothetical protein [Streptomyces sp. RKAG337]MCM2424876.1 hypothetical protein [Streptomyces sp. RKAG337]
MTSTPVSLPFDYEFRHPTWVDTVDRVAAGGPNGFNALFEALQKDLTAIDQLFATAAGAVNALQAKVDALGQPQAVNRSVTVIPMLASIAGQQAWDVTSTPGSAAKPAGAATAQGLVTVALPAGSVITGFKAGAATSDRACWHWKCTASASTGRIRGSWPRSPSRGCRPAAFSRPIR